MMDILFIGDEISAAGFRLAGLDVLVPESGEEKYILDKINKNTDFIIITAQIAAAVPQHTMDHLMQIDRPLLLVITDMRNHMSSPDLALSLRSQLGMK